MLQLIRIKNLFIIALTLLILRVKLVAYPLATLSQEPFMQDWHFSILILGVLLIAGAGYIINDFYDVLIDKINKPLLQLIGKDVSEKEASITYLIFNLVALGMGLYLFFIGYNKQILSLYSITIIFLWLYAKYFKKMFFIGNATVAFLCALVPIIFYYAEKESFLAILKSDTTLYHYTLKILIFYSIFAFLSTFLREIVKDIEDIEGDKQFDAQTIAAYSGISTAKSWFYAFNIPFLSILFIWLEYVFKNNQSWYALLINIFLILIVIYAIIKMYNAKVKEDFTDLQSYYKSIMMFGLLALVVA